MSTTNKFSVSSRCKSIAGILVAFKLIIVSTPCWAQATSRQCEDVNVNEEQAGPACLLSHESLGSFNVDTVYWSLDKYSSVEAAQRDLGRSASVIKAFGSFWLFTIGPVASRPLNGEHVAQVGPISIDKNTSYDAEFLKSTFSRVLI